MGDETAYLPQRDPRADSAQDALSAPVGFEVLQWRAPAPMPPRRTSCLLPLPALYYIEASRWEESEDSNTLSAQIAHSCCDTSTMREACFGNVRC